MAPYATALAAMVEPVAAVANFERLAAIGALGPYGYYESIDYTPARVPEGAAFAIVHAFMAHHQGMTIVALANVLRGSVMRRRFRVEPAVQATEAAAPGAHAAHGGGRAPRSAKANRGCTCATRFLPFCGASAHRTTRRPARTFCPTAAIP